VVLGLFVLAAGAVYGLWGAEFSSPELAGTFYLTVLGVAFMYLAHVLLAAARAGGAPGAASRPGCRRDDR